MRAFVLISLAACSFPEKHLATGGDGGSDGQGSSDAARDGSPGDALPGFECVGQPLATSAPQTISFTGLVTDAQNGNPMPNQNLALEDPIGNPLGNANTDPNGRFLFPYSTSGRPVDGHFFAATMPTNAAALVYPPHPYASDTVADFVVYQNSTVQSLVFACGSNYDSTKGVIALIVEDCDGHPLAGATVQRPQASAGLCYGGVSSASVTDQTGKVLVFSLLPATVTVSAMTSGGLTLYPRDVMVQPNSVTELVLQPGP
jgi:hypothetical protein